MIGADTDALVADLAHTLVRRGWRVATAESCTGGLIAAACTRRSGSSDWFDRGFVTYSNPAKTEMLGVPAEVIHAHGAVSEPVVLAMARGARERAGVDVAVSVSGIAGPTGGSAEKPVGTVWLAWSGPWGEHAQRHLFGGDRDAVRSAALCCALQGLVDRAGRDATDGGAR